MVELMITVAVLAILAVIAFPSFDATMRSNRVSTATNEMIASLSLARMEALRNPEGAVICATANGTTCGNDWNEGWMVFIDADGNGDPGGANDRVLRHVQGKGKVSVKAESAGGATFASRIIFDNRGRVDTHTRTIGIQPDPCASSEQLQRTISVTHTGQARTTKVACS